MPKSGYRKLDFMNASAPLDLSRLDSVTARSDNAMEDQLVLFLRPFQCLICLFSCGTWWT